MSGLSGQAEITITKPNGRVIRQVITNNIEEDVYTGLQNRIIDSSVDYPAAYVPKKVKTSLSSGAFIVSDVTPSTGVSEVKYTIDEVTGASFDTTSGDLDYPVSKVELLGSTDTVIATALTTNSTFTADSNVDAANLIDEDDKVNVTYKLKFQSNTGGASDDYVEQLLTTITTGTGNISLHSYEIRTADDVLIDSIGNNSLSEALTASNTDDDSPADGVIDSFTTEGTARFPGATSEPHTFKIKTSAGTEVLSDDVSEDESLDDWVDGSNVEVPFRFTLTRVTSGIT